MPRVPVYEAPDRIGRPQDAQENAERTPEVLERMRLTDRNLAA
jgi:hypothetical protein